MKISAQLLLMVLHDGNFLDYRLKIDLEMMWIHGWNFIDQEILPHIHIMKKRRNG